MSRIGDDGLYDLAYDDGDFEEKVQPQYVKPPKGQPKPQPAEEPAAPASNSSRKQPAPPPESAPQPKRVRRLDIGESSSEEEEEWEVDGEEVVDDDGDEVVDDGDADADEGAVVKEAEGYNLLLATESRSTTGYLGVTKHASGKFQAQRGVGGKKVHLGNV